MAKRLQNSPTGEQKVCPACSKSFYRYIILKDNGKKQRVCPNCRVPLHECDGTRLKGIYLQADSESAGRLVQILEAHISKRNDVNFEFNVPERSQQLIHAYALVERSKEFISKQPNDYGISPYELVEEAVEKTLEGDVWKITDNLLFLRNRIGPIAQQLFKEKRQGIKSKRNAASTYTDISSYLA